jgi:hypothetical protein
MQGFCAEDKYAIVLQILGCIDLEINIDKERPSKYTIENIIE